MEQKEEGWAGAERVRRAIRHGAIQARAESVRQEGIARRKCDHFLDAGCAASFGVSARRGRRIVIQSVCTKSIDRDVMIVRCLRAARLAVLPLVLSAPVL